MSFDIFFQTSHHTDRIKECSDPFTGETITRPDDDPITNEERAALIAYLADNGIEGSKGDDCLMATLTSGDSIELYFNELFGDVPCDGGMIALRGLSASIAKFVHDIADRGNFVVLPSMEGNPKIVTSQETADRVTSRWPDVMTASTSDQLLSIISGKAAG